MGLYRHSGRVPIAGLILCSLLLAPLAIFGGAAYSAAMVFLPFIKLKWLISLLFAAAVGFVVGKVCESGKIRNRGFVILATVITMGLAYYVSWGVQRFWLVVGELGFDGAIDNVGLADLLPISLAAWVTWLFENGLWSMRGGADTIKGWPLVVLWGIEAATLFVTSWTLALGTYGFRPFCEACERWTTLDVGIAELPVDADDPAWAEVRDGRFEALRHLKINPAEDRHARIDLATCPECETGDHVLISGVVYAVDKEGNLTATETPIIEYLHMTREKTNELREFAAEMNEAVELMRADEEALSEEATDE
ncbi:hypothetical protein EC9_51930 [Rosistilla ulvae]|uniref:Uncharacterized protein n=1 Tax=Rosistilla ulvae TaxID=1930277 RepID=A0A517M7W8_9BACT|nr:hypothetical protein [Rosistilla ulvae]QDS90974.1 hypothetical protein EC9_51930 [Rosistilla ulvae]